MNTKRLNIIVPLLVFLVSFVIYILTLAPTVYLEDSGELVSAAYSLGVAHPPGYPLYVVIGKLFSLLPFGTIVYKINLMSAFFGSLTCALLFLVIQKILTSLNLNSLKSRSATDRLVIFRIIPISASLILGFSSTFWTQSIIAEVYTLNSFLFTLIILLLIRWSDLIKAGKKNNKYLLWSAFLLGLSITNHQMMLLFAPAFAIYVLMIDKTVIKKYKLIIGAFVLFLLGLSFYLFMILRTKYGHPDFAWGDTYNWVNLKKHILREQYKDFGQFKIQDIFNSDKLLYINGLFNTLLSEFTILGIILSTVGFIFLWFKNKAIWIFTLLLFLANNLLIIFLRNQQFTFANELMFKVYCLPSFIILSIYLAICFYYLYTIVSKSAKAFTPYMKQILNILYISILLIMPISYLLSNYQVNNRNDFTLVDEYSRALLNSLDPNSMLLLYTDQPAFDSISFSLMYQQVVNDLRPDVKVINVSTIKGKLYVPLGDIFKNKALATKPDNIRKTELAEILWEFRKDASLYLLYPLGIGVDQSLVTRSNGWAYKVYSNLEEAKADQESYQDLEFIPISNLENSNLENNLFYRDLLSEYYYIRAAYYLETGQVELYDQFIDKGVNYDASHFGLNYNLLLQHTAIWQGKEPQIILKYPPKEVLNQ